MATIKELRKQATAAGITGASKLKKADLETALAGNSGTTEPTPLEANESAVSTNPTTGQLEGDFNSDLDKGYIGIKADPAPNEKYAYPNPGEES